MALKLIRNDIVQMSADAIVNTANPEPKVGTGTDAAIYKAAGYHRMLLERKLKGRLKPGEVCVTTAGKLDAKYVIHACSVMWQGGGHGEEEILRKCYRNALEEVRKRGLKSVAFPVLGSGNYHTPVKYALRAAIEEIERFPGIDDVLVYLVVFGQDTYQTCCRLYGEIESRIDPDFVTRREQQEQDLQKLLAEELSEEAPEEASDEAAFEPWDPEAASNNREVDFFRELCAFSISEGEDSCGEDMQEEEPSEDFALASAASPSDREELPPVSAARPAVWEELPSVSAARPAAWEDSAPVNMQMSMPAVSESAASKKTPKKAGINVRDVSVWKTRGEESQSVMGRRKDSDLFPPSPGGMRSTYGTSSGRSGNINIKEALSRPQRTFYEMLCEWIRSKNKTAPETYQGANMTKQTFSKIKKNPNYHPKKETVLALAISLGLNLNEATEFLAFAGYAFSPNEKVDIVVQYYLQKEVKSLSDVELTLEEYDLPTLTFGNVG